MLQADLRNQASSKLPLSMNVKMGDHGRAMHIVNCSIRPHLRAALTAGRSLTSTPVCCISSLSKPSSPQKFGHNALRRPLGPRLASILQVSRKNSTSHQELPLPAVQTDGINNSLRSTPSFDQFAGQVLRQSTKTPQAELTREAGSEEGSSIRPPTTSPGLLLLSLFKRLVPRGLLPQVTTEPPSPVGHEPAWTVTISLCELGIDVKGRGSNILFAEVAAAIELDLALSSPEIVAKLSSCSQTRLSPTDAKNIEQSYWQFVHASSGALKRTTTELDSGAFEVRTFAGSTQIGDPVTSAVKESARGIQSLTLAHAIINGHPDLWPVSLENPFQARIVLDHARLEKLQHLITATNDYLRTAPGHVIGGKGRGTFYRPTQEGPEQDTVNARGGFEGAPHRDIPDLQSWLAALPFPPFRAKMLVAGASIRCLEHAILLAAIEKHAVYRGTASRGKEDDGYRNPATTNVMEGDHPGVLLLFQRLRDEGWAIRKQMRLPKTEDGAEKSSQLHDDAQDQDMEDVTPDTNDPVGHHEGFQALPNGFPEPLETSSTNEAMVARRFNHFDPDAIASVNAAAREIERSMITAGLVGYPKEASYISVPGSELKVRAEPYGGNLSRTTHKRSTLRHLLVLGFPENIAQIGYGTLAPGQPPQLRINSEEVYMDSPLKAPMPQKQLHKNLRAGPMMVVTGVTSNPEGGGLSARYCTPLSTWEAVLLGKDLTLPDGKETPVAGAVQVLVNNWFPVLVKSEVEGVSNEQARDTLFEAREALHRAIDKAMYDYVKYSWHSVDFYDLLMDLPNEDSFQAMAMPKEKRDAMKNEPRRPRPREYQPHRQDRMIKDVNK
ncbi:hypothetical protein INS49_008763 [Diaporthe citri]|uniref:uncharacterized protein n=1 Tax=Diaporthe citri TaxID=83186 RepID=UPI001C82716C|nr:uncharacterized protein INS49_008763 [Diaporthe citri]KAG6363662.1 hypothetical protein INS49_008763 [Diaporthe citri]